jgi:hypothetical protein
MLVAKLKRAGDATTDMMGLSGRAAIVGVAESDAIGGLPNKSTLQLVAEASLNALDDAGLAVRDVVTLAKFRPR